VSAAAAPSRGLLRAPLTRGVGGPVAPGANAGMTPTPNTHDEPGTPAGDNA
jgi:hypothetical protein